MGTKTSLCWTVAVVAAALATLWFAIPDSVASRAGGGQPALEKSVAPEILREKPVTAVLDQLSPSPVESERRSRRVDLDRGDARFRTQCGASAVGGWIDREDGMPATRAHVVLIPMRNGAPQFAPTEEHRVGGPTANGTEATCDANGVFYCKVATAGPHVLVAFESGHRPAVRFIELEDGCSLELEPLALERGLAITGRVLAGLEPLERAEIAASLEEIGDIVRFGDVALSWRDERFEWAFPVCESGPNGQYELAGLAPSAYRVGIGSVRCKSCALDGRRVGKYGVIAPATAIDFTLPFARFVLTFLCAGEPVPGVEVQIDANERQYTRMSGSDGSIDLRIAPAPSYAIVASRGGYVSRRATFPGLRLGEDRAEVIELEAERERAELVVHTRGANAGDHADFVFTPVAPEGGRAEPPFRVSANRDRSANTFTLKRMPEGMWHVSMSSGDRVQFGSVTRTPFVGRANCESIFDVTIPARGRLQVPVDVAALATFEVRAVDELGQGITAMMSLAAITETPNALSMPVLFGLSSVGADQQRVARDDIAAEGWTTCMTEICAGAVEATIWHPGRRPASVPIDFDQGSPGRIEVVLPRP